MKPLLKVLVVDDDRSVCAAIKRGLEKTGRFTVLVAGAGAEGFDLACEHLPDVILLDMMMPRLTGAEVAMMLRADPLTAGIPYIFLTGLIDKASALDLGNDIDGEQYLAKPASTEEILDAIRLALARRGAEKEFEG